MRWAELDAAEAEAMRFLKKIDQWRKVPGDEFRSPSRAAVLRSALDLKNELTRLRKSPHPR